VFSALMTRGVQVLTKIGSERYNCYEKDFEEDFVRAVKDHYRKEKPRMAAAGAAGTAGDDTPPTVSYAEVVRREMDLVGRIAQPSTVDKIRVGLCDIFGLDHSAVAASVPSS